MFFHMRAEKANSRVSGTRAWLVRWDWIGDHAKVENPIVAILPSQWGVERIKTVVEVVHDAKALTPAEMAHFARKRRDRPYEATLDTVTMDTDHGPINVPWEGAVLCGHNPWVEARQVTVFIHPGSQEVSWEPVPKPPRVNVDAFGFGTAHGETTPDRSQRHPRTSPLLPRTRVL